MCRLIYALIALALLTGSAMAQSTSNNWAGYFVSGTVTSVSAQWRVPAQYGDSGDSAATWIGIGGCSPYCGGADSTLIQVGIDTTNSAVHTVNYYTWYELIPAFQTILSGSVKPGDIMQVSIDCTSHCTTCTSDCGSSSSSTTWDITLQNITQGWTDTNPVNYGSKLQGAEAILESHAGSKVANFGTVPFTTFRVNGANPGITLGSNGLQLDDPSGNSASVSSPSGGDAFRICWGTTSFTTCPTGNTLLPDSGSGVKRFGQP